MRLRSASSLFFAAFAMFSVAPLAACSAEGEGTSEGGDELTGGGSYVGTAVIARLRAEHATEEGITWSDSNDARFDAD